MKRNFLILDFLRNLIFFAAASLMYRLRRGVHCAPRASKLGYARSLLCAVSISAFFTVSGCSTPKNYSLPKEDQYQGYKIIDGVDKDTVFAKIDTEDKIAIVLRDIATTSYSFIEPRYNNSMVHFDGKSQCCGPESPLMGNSGLVVYKFSFIGKGTTAINLIARQKGLSATASSFETDHLVTVNAEVK